MRFSADGLRGRTSTYRREKNATWVIIDRLTKMADFIDIRNTWMLDQLARA